MLQKIVVLILIVGVAIGIATLQTFAHPPSILLPQSTSLGQIELVSRAAFRPTYAATDPDISRFGNVVTMRLSEYELYIKEGAFPWETTRILYVPYLFSIGCTQSIVCSLEDYDLAGEGEYVLLSARQLFGDFGYTYKLVRYHIGSGDTELLFSTEDFIEEIASSGNGTVIAWVNRQEDDPTNTEAIYLYYNGSSILVTDGYDGSPATGISINPSLSTNGQWLAYDSTANNLVPNDSGGRDIFIYDRGAATTQRVTFGYEGSAPNGNSYHPQIDTTGRYIAFVSEATNLVPNDTNGVADIFLYDHVDGSIRRLSIAGDGTQANAASTSPSIAENSNVIAFVSSATNLVPKDTNGVDDAFVYDLSTNTIRRASIATDGTQANKASGSVWLSADGGYVLFDTDASLEPRDRGGYDLYTNSPSGQIYRVNYKPFSITPDGTTQLVRNGLSADGRYVIFNFGADNLLAFPPPIPGENREYAYEYDRHTRKVTRIDLPHQGGARVASGNRRFILFETLDENSYRMEQYDRQTGTSAVVHTKADGTEVPIANAWAVMSGDGRYVALSVVAPTWVPGASSACPNPDYCPLVYLKDMVAGTVTHITVDSNGTPANMGVPWSGVAVSDDGVWVAFVADADNLVPNDTNYVADIFVHNIITSETRRVSVSNEGIEGNNTSIMPLSFSNDGRYLMFSSSADNLVTDDPNGAEYDSFLYDLTTETITIIPLTEDGTITNTGSGFGILSGDGNTVAFNTSVALLPNDQDEDEDLYLRDLRSGEQWLATIPYGAPQPPLSGGGSTHALSDDGTIVAFTNERLTWLDFNNAADLYLFDRAALPLSHRVFLPTLRY